MSKAIAVFHGRFGRATIYQLNRPFNTHAHREGHLIFHLGGADGSLEVSEKLYRLTSESVVAVSPWEPHNFIPQDLESGALFFVLNVDPEWFGPGGDVRRLRFGCSQIARTGALDAHIRHAAAMIHAGEHLGELDRDLRSLIDACYDESWRQANDPEEQRTLDRVTDFRVRKSIRLMQESLGADIELEAVARESGLSRPHFYKLFRTHTGLTPNLYLNTLLMERAIDKLARSAAAVAEIGSDLGFSSQSCFTRFFTANVGMAPTD